MRKVKYAKTHQNLFIPGAGELGSVFPPPNKTLSGLQMSADDDLNLTLSFSFKGVKFEVLVPSANVALHSVAQESK